MDIGKITPALRDITPQISPSPSIAPGATGDAGGFLETLKSFISESNELQGVAASKVQSLISGESTDVHDVMVAMEKAGVSFNMVMEIRNKMMEAYQEVIRTPV